jgi:dihydrofolate synthase/folylpolyglutamate synthase
MPRAPITTFAQAHEVLARFVPANVGRRPYMLDHMRAFMQFLGNPQDRLKVIHVAGTSGKTSTSYYVASLLHEAGKKVGLSVSPYVHQMNERVQVDLVPMPEARFCRELSEFLGLAEESNIELTLFELLSAFAYWQFARQGVDYAVIEVGLGGELDATNVVQARSKVCVITDIGLDHQEVLGRTLPEIAAQKAGIIQLHNAVFVRRQPSAALEPIRARARQKQADLHIVAPEDMPEQFAFLPLFQQRNFGLAQAAVHFVGERDGVRLPGTGARLRAARVHIPARMEAYRIGDKTVVLDGAHNEQKLAALFASLQHRYPAQPFAVLAAFKAGQTERIEAATAVLTRAARRIIVTSYGAPDAPPGTLHGEDPHTLAALCKIHGFWEVEAISDISHAWRELLASPEPVLVVTGSLYMFNDIYPLLGEHAFTPDA